MVLYARVKKQIAQRFIEWVKKQDLYLKGYPIKAEDHCLLVPVKSKLDEMPSFLDSISYVEKTEPKRFPTRLKPYLREKYGVNCPISSYDVVGDIAIIEDCGELTPLIGQAILEIQKNVSLVCVKKSPMSGVFRVREVAIVAKRPDRSPSTQTTYHENGVALSLDISKVYFSPRLSYERGRIASLVKPHERVMVFFAGVGPFALVIGKKVRSANVVGIELNPAAVQYFKKNIEKNKLTNVVAVEGDVRLEKKNYEGWADRVVMPLPKGAEDFLTDAIDVLQKQGTIHFYTFVEHEKGEDPCKKAEQLFLSKMKNAMVKKMESRIVRPFSPTTVQVVVDAEVEKN